MVRVSDLAKGPIMISGSAVDVRYLKWWSCIFNDLNVPSVLLTEIFSRAQLISVRHSTLKFLIVLNLLQ